MLKIQETAEKAKQAFSLSWVKTAGRFLISFLLSVSDIGGMRPLGLAYAASDSRDDIAKFSGAFFGSVTAFAEGGILYAAAVMICFALRLVFRNTAAMKLHIFMPFCCALSLWCVKGVLVLSEPSFKTLILLICEGILCAGASLLFKSSEISARQNYVWAGRALMVLGILTAFEPFRFLGFLSLARTAASFTVILAAYCYGSTVGVSCGIFAGALLDISSLTPPRLAFIYGLGGLLGGGGKTAPRPLRAGMFLVGCLSAVVWYGSFPQNGAVVAECALVFLSLAFAPEKTVLKIENTLSPKASATSDASHVSLKISQAVDSLGELVTSVPRKPLSGSISAALDRAADCVCSTCPEAKHCWGKHYAAVKGAFAGIASAFAENSEITAEDMPHFLSQNCKKLSKLCREINRQVDNMRRREGVLRKRAENESLMARQYRGISELLDDLCGENGTRTELCSLLQSKAQTIAKKYFRDCFCKVYSKNARIIIDIELSAGSELSDAVSMGDSLSLGLGFKLGEPRLLENGKRRILRFYREAIIEPSVHTACKCKHKEKECGDSLKHIFTKDGRFILILSDGMGTGQSAGKQSSDASDAVMRMITAGASLCAAAKAVTPALDAKFESSGFVTLDMLEIDLLTSDARFVKYGACPSYIVRGSTLQKVWQQSLPAGLKSEGSFLSCKLRPGDKILMMTDGTSLPDRFDGSGSELCAAMTSGVADDDMTAAVITVSGV